MGALYLRLREAAPTMGELNQFKEGNMNLWQQFEQTLSKIEEYLDRGEKPPRELLELEFELEALMQEGEEEEEQGEESP